MTDEQIGALIDDPVMRTTSSALEFTQLLLERITTSQRAVNAFITVTPDLALADARRVDARRNAGWRSPLDGLPIAVKDNIDVGGVRTTVGSKMFERNVATQDAEVVRRLRSAGAIILGKTNLHELAYGTTSNNATFGPTRNPWDLKRIPGGSSGGSGAAVSADLCVGALGSDTGGSVRIPAALNGVSGLRPTYGSVSNRGTFPVSWSFDIVGPMARSVHDVWRLFAVIMGFDRCDPRAVERAAKFSTDEQPRRLDGVRIGLPEHYFFENVDSEITDSVRAAADIFTTLGAELVSVSIEGAQEANRVCNLIIRAEAFAIYRARCDEHPELIAEDIVQRLRLGADIGGAELAMLFQRMYEWRCGVRELFSNVDLVLTPTTDCLAPTIASSETIATTAVLTRLTYPWSLAHLPALAVPCGLSASDLPIGLQLAARPWEEALLLQAGAAFQRVTDWHRKRPPVFAHAMSSPVQSPLRSKGQHHDS